MTKNEIGAQLQKQFVSLLAQRPDLSDAISRLPQLDVVPVERLARFTINLAKYHGDRAAWHLNRLSGVGGSEIAGVLKGMNAKYADESTFSDVAKINEQKLLMRLPDFSNEHTLRGTRGEAFAAAVCKHRYGYEIDHEAMAHFANAKPSELTPWLRGEPDAIVLIGGKRYLLDFKIPNQPSTELEFMYKAQLNHLSLGCEAAGIGIDGMLLAKLNLPADQALAMVKNADMSEELLNQKAKFYSDFDASTRQHNLALANHFHPNDKEAQAKWLDEQPIPLIQLVQVPNDLELKADIIKAGGEFWNGHVLTGEPVKVKLNALTEMTQEHLETFSKYLETYATGKHLASHFNNLANKARDEMAAVALEKGVPVADYKFDRNLVTVGTKKASRDELVNRAIEHGAVESEITARQDSVEKLKEEIKRLGGDPESPELMDVVEDAAAAEKWLKEQGISVDDASGELAFRVSGSKANKAYLEEKTAGVVQAAAELSTPEIPEESVETKPTAQARSGPSL